MPDAMLTALIAATVSILVAGLGLVATALQLRMARKKHDREIAHSFSERVYEQRIAIYPDGYAILGRIRKLGPPHHLPHPENIRQIKDDLNHWADRSSIFFSRDALQAYWELRKALAKNPAHGFDYSEEQAEKVFAARNRLRQHMRQDIGNLYVGDTNETAADYWEYL